MREPSRRTGDRPVVGLLVAAGAVALVTVGVVLRFGLVQPPALEPVDEATRPDVALAISSYRDNERGQCLDVVDPDGTVRELRCGMDGGPLVAWDERGIIIIRYASFGERLEVLDPDTGAVLSSSTFDSRVVMPGRWDGMLDVDRVGRTLIVYGDDRSVLWQVEAPDSYRITATARDPRTGTVALLDEAGRLLVLRGGADEPRVWVEDVGTRYGELVWQGTPLTSD
jgi:hypothetical protein